MSTINKVFVLFFCFTTIVSCGNFFCFDYVNALESDIIITLRFENNIFEYKLSQNIPKVNNHFEYRQLQKYNRLGNAFEHANMIEYIVDNGFLYREAYQYMFFGWDKFYSNVTKSINKEPLDAKLIFLPDKKPYFEISQDSVGYIIDDEFLLKRITTELAKTNNVLVDISPKVLRPKVLKSELQKETTQLSSFGTNYKTSNNNRKQNIKTALKKFNGMIVYPKQIISFNDTTGRRTKENGYYEAKIIKDKQYIEALGGGVCQASTTLYNALILAGVDILEVNPHSLAPSYINFAFDAMVNYGSSDLCFQNNFDTPIYIRTECDIDTVKVQIFGKKTNNYKIKRVTEIVKKITPPSDKEILDTKCEYIDKVMYDDESFYQSYPRVGYKVKGYLEYYDGDKLLNKRKIRDVTYQAVQGVKIRGTKKRVEILDNEQFLLKELNI